MTVRAAFLSFQFQDAISFLDALEHGIDELPKFEGRDEEAKGYCH